MAAVFAFFGMLLISMVVALLAALQLGDFFLASDEFALVIAGVAGFTAFSLAVFAIVYAATRQARPITSVALLLAVLALAPVALPGIVQKIAERSSDPGATGMENIHIALELSVPALLAVLVQWGLVRRRWLRLAGEDDLTRWPWFTTALGALVILNPYGLAFLQGSLKRTDGDFRWDLTATITCAVLLTLLVMAWVECYIRERILDRRLGVPGSSPRGANSGDFLQEASDARNH